MKKILKFLLVIAIIIIILNLIIQYNSKNKDGNENIAKYSQIEEIVVDNRISLKAKEIHDYIRENKYGYCTYDDRCSHDGKCGLNATFDASKTGYHNTCCATYVSWVLQETGYITKKEHIDNYLNGANNLWNYLIKKGWTEVTDKSNLQPGDILCYNNHIAIYGGRGAQYDAGNKALLEHEAPCKIVGGLDTQKILRAPDL